MKSIIIDMKDLSDSKEVYDSRPNPFFAVFLYLVLLIVTVACLWSAFFTIDIVVKGTGTIMGAEDSLTVTNTMSGRVVAAHVVDGQMVKAGDLLYEVEHTDLSLQLNNYMRQKDDLEERQEMAAAYAGWLGNRDLDLSGYQGNTYYGEYQARQALAKLGMDAVLIDYDSQEDTYDARIAANVNQIDYYQNEISYLQRLSDAIVIRENPFIPEEAFYRQKAQNYIEQYENTKKQYEFSIIPLEDTRNKAQSEVNKINKNIETLDQTIADAKGKIDELLAGGGNTPSGNGNQDISGGDILQNAILALQTQINNAQAEKTSQETLKTNQENVVTAQNQQINSLNVQKDNTLKNLEIDTVAGIDNTIISYQQTLLIYEGNQSEYETALSTMDAGGSQGQINNVLQTELQSITGELTSCEAQLEELQTTITGLEDQIDEATVRSSIDGIVNLSEELVVGNYLPAGSNILTVIPENDDSYQVRSYIDNQDIAKVNEGMEVKYEIAAYPSSEYGNLYGTVDFISVDLKVNDQAGSAYYLVESNIDGTALYNQAGEIGALKQGMLCQTKIIIEEKSVLRFLLEKIRLID
jgi:multidrug efflux pump subunit AcrA (membrane-fusion protein)